ncbi:thiamine phosphate synthase [Paenibacillus sp. 1011MAR3C5]|uniref:thiamine phosphate synthase n=1 Tax=Paenibacillus sp. 1011MAR3C5 TaxID=1675787 RepID=UPI00269C995C|nr:thiamine phosphate synthase [Paenibacillus sp. 1011MAR3C5]
MIERQWSDFELYVITASANYPGRDLIEVMEQTLIGGAGMLQLRNKTGSREEVLHEATALRKLTRAYGVPFIVNDYVDIAIQVGADGVHIGQDDMPMAEARQLLGPGKLIGVSTHSLEQALKAERDGADYIGVGPVYPTNTKPGRAAVSTSYVSEAAAHIGIPFVAIGGITLDNADLVLEAGARRLCAVSAIVGSEDPAAACRSFLDKIARCKTKERRTVTIRLNGETRHTSAGNLEELVRELGQSHKRIVAELNGALVSKGMWADTAIEPEADVELIQFVGGG